MIHADIRKNAAKYTIFSGITDMFVSRLVGILKSF